MIVNSEPTKTNTQSQNLRPRLTCGGMEIKVVHTPDTTGLFQYLEGGADEPQRPT